MDNNLKIFEENLRKVLIIVSYPEDQINSFISKSILLILERGLIEMGDKISKEMLDSFHETAQKGDLKLALEEIDKLQLKHEYDQVLKRELGSYFQNFVTRLKTKSQKSHKSQIQEVLDQFAYLITL